MSYPQAHEHRPPLTRGSKSMLLAYVLWFFLGNLGVHRYYLNSVFAGLAQLTLLVVGGFLSIFGIGFFLLFPLWLWLVFDLFWIYKRVN